MTSMTEDRWGGEGYPAIYYQTIADLGIDPVVCGPFGSGLVTIGAEGCEESGSSGPRPVQLAEKALAKASAAGAKTPRKRTARKATGAAAEGSEPVSVPARRAAKAAVPKQTPAKTARGTAKVASSG